MNATKRSARLATALHTLGAKDSELAARQLLRELEQRYAEAHRHYHTIQHVDSCLSWFDLYQAQAQFPAEVELALCFHDVVYDPTQSDNEEQSADLAATRLALCGVAPESVERIRDLVLATKRHAATDGDAALVCSIDLAILGATPDRFAEYEAGVRREYCHVPESIYREARGAFLAEILGRGAIYSNAALRAQFEVPAQRNLRASIQRTGSLRP